MEAFYDFLNTVNSHLVERGWDRLEETLASAIFSGMTSEFLVTSIAKQSAVLCKNLYHNGRPDLVPCGSYPEDKIKHGVEGVEVKASTYESAWQGHNAELGWILIFQFVRDRSTAAVEHRTPTMFERVLIAHLDESDWKFSPRGEGSRRTPTASITPDGMTKLLSGVIYVDPNYVPGRGRVVRRRVAKPAAKPSDL